MMSLPRPLMLPELDSSPIVDHASDAPERQVILPEVFKDARIEKIPSWSSDAIDAKEVDKIDAVTYASSVDSPNTPIAPMGLPSPSSPVRKVIGLRRTTFFLTLALVTMIIAAAAIGIGIGITALNAPRDQKPVTVAAPANTTTTSSNSTATPSTTSTNITTLYASECTNNTNYQSERTCDVYRKYCSVSWENLFWGLPIINMVAPDFNTCIEYCDSYNYWSRSRADADTLTNMTAVIYGSGLSKDTGYVPGSCYCASHNANQAQMVFNEGVNIAIRFTNWTQTTCLNGTPNQN